jgi:murein L,D-transpeptidase YcbB/YkuD
MTVLSKAVGTVPGFCELGCGVTAGGIGNDDRVRRREVAAPKCTPHKELKMNTTALDQRKQAGPWIAATVAVLLLSCPGPSATAGKTAGASEEKIRETVKQVVSSGTHPEIRWKTFPYYKDELENVYGPRNYALVWFDGYNVHPKADHLIAAVSRAEDQGLDAESYDAAMLTTKIGEIRSGDLHKPEQLALFDTAMSIAFLRYISDLHVGRINPENLHIGLDVEDKKYDLASVLDQALNQGEIESLIANVQPAFPVYKRIKQILPKYRALAADESLRPLPLVEPVVKPGDAYAGTVDLARLLAAVGDVAESQVPTARAGIPTPVYEGPLVEGVKRFQERHGLGADGVIGPATFGALNTPMSHRLRSIEMALERLRWLPYIGEEDFIIVNVPAFQLWAINRGELGKFAAHMNVIVGKSIDKAQTPIFSDRIKYIDFSPYWNVPFSITSKELLPKIRRDPGYLDAHDMEIVKQFGNDEPALPATAENIDALASGHTNLRQRPGPKNALGMVKFIFPNAHNVYLHSTPAQQLFSKTRRDFSHGCIRIEKPTDLAEWLLRSDPEWNRGAIEAAMDGSHPRRVFLKNPVPVYIFYASVMVDTDGTAFFYPDIYKHDELLEQALDKGYPYDP